MHVWLGGGVLLHRFEVFNAAPLRVVGDLGAVQAAMNVGRDEAGQERIVVSVA